MATVETLQVSRFAMGSLQLIDEGHTVSELIHRVGSSRRICQEGHLGKTGASAAANGLLEQATSDRETLGLGVGVTHTCASQLVISESEFSTASSCKLSGAEDSLCHLRKSIDELPKFQHLDKGGVTAWKGGPAPRPRDVHCATRSREESRASARRGPPSKGFSAYSNDAEFFIPPLHSFPAEAAQRVDMDLHLHSSPFHSLQEGLLTGQKMRLNDLVACRSDEGAVEALRSKGSDEGGAMSFQFWSDLMSGLTDARLHKEAAEFDGKHSYADLDADLSSREDSESGSSEGDEVEHLRPLLMHAHGKPRIKSILLVKAVQTSRQQHLRLSQSGKRVRWRDSHGDALVSIREFDVSDIPLYSWENDPCIQDDDEGLCTGCCTVS